MLQFLTYDAQGQPAPAQPPRNAYIVGADGHAMRSQIEAEFGSLIVEKREAGAAALCLLHPVGDLGELVMQTCLLPERPEPYILALELARHRLMVMYNKLEDWGLFDLPADHPAMRRAEPARKRFIEALCLQRDDPAGCAKLSQQCLVLATDATEELALAHSSMMLTRRAHLPGSSRTPLGCGVSMHLDEPRLMAALKTQVDFVQMPLSWKTLCPEEGKYQWETADRWCEWSKRTNTPLVAGPVLSFEPSELPDWLYIWEHDYDTVRDLIYEHVERVVDRYRPYIHAWNIVSGLHVNKHFTFNFEQLMDLTRMCTMLVKKLDTASRVIVEMREPFGEYYAAHQRSIPPMMYGDLLIQSSIQFDALAIRFPMGQAVPGQYARDLMQLSDMLDRFAHFGKPIAVTLAAPSEPVTSLMIANPDSNDPADDHAGYWRRPWNTTVQAHWLEAAMQVVCSKPYVEAVAWQDLNDHPNAELPLSGLIDDDFQPKPAWKHFVAARRGLLSNQAGATTSHSTHAPSRSAEFTPPAEKNPDD